MAYGNFMTPITHATALFQYLQSRGITTPEPVKLGWTHVGGIIVDAVLQAQRSYEKVVRPRVLHIINTYPEASTTSGFLGLMKQHDLKDVMQYQSDIRAHIAQDLATGLLNHKLETVEDVRECFQTPDARTALVKDLRRIRGVGPKTVNYLGILVGDPHSFAIDARIYKVLRVAGVPRLTYGQAENVIRETASLLGWPVGALDATLWKLDI